ncbi:MAG: hypothetical protein NC093_03600 [Alistipes sp.]|nr:hypothetical protein [Alistipes sp.]
MRIGALLEKYFAAYTRYVILTKGSEFDSHQELYMDVIDDIAKPFNNPNFKWYRHMFEIYWAVKKCNDNVSTKITNVTFKDNDFCELIILPSVDILYGQLKKKCDEQSSIDEFVSFLRDCSTSLMRGNLNPQLQIFYDRLADNNEGLGRLNSLLEQLQNKQVKISNELSLNRGLQEEVKKISAEAKDIRQEIKEQSQKVAESSITILGIFVGIVMVFFGGFSILDNTIETLSQVSPYRLYFTMIVFGCIMYNIVVLLFFLVSRITEKSITCRCHHASQVIETSRNDCYKCKQYRHHKGICRVRNTLPYVYWSNLCMFAAMSFLFGMKFFAKQENPLQLNCKQFGLSSILPFILIVTGYIFCKPKPSQKNKENESEDEEKNEKDSKNTIERNNTL